MKLDDIPAGPRTGLFLVLADSDERSDTTEVVGWTTSLDDAAWWATRPGVRVVKARDTDFHDTGIDPEQ